jgi:hypothetical protein
LTNPLNRERKNGSHTAKVNPWMLLAETMGLALTVMKIGSFDLGKT